MEPSPTRYWILFLAAAILACVLYLSWKHAQSPLARKALASLVLGVAGLLFPPLGPLAIYFGRKGVGARSEAERATVLMSRAGIVLGTIASLFLAGILLMAAVYLYGYWTHQYP